MINRSRSRRTKKGASLVLVAACAGLLLLCIFGCFKLTMLLSGAEDARNTVDAAALNVAKRAVDIKASVSPDFSDCADSGGGVGLSNINRVWGKAYLVNANAASMNSEGTGSDASTANAMSACQNAQAMNDELFGSLNSGQNLGNYFNQLSAQRPLKMPGSETIQAISTDQWKTAEVDRGLESNLSFSNNQLPPNCNANLSGIDTGGSQYIAGYTPFSINGQNFYFVSFRYGEKPHLVSASFFGGNRGDTDPLGGITNPLPNAFAVQGQSNPNSGQSLGGLAYAVANPQRQYTLAIPHAFVTIRINNRAIWYVNGKKVNQTTYGLEPETQWGAKNIPLPECGGKLNGYASLGNEYKVSSLFNAITSLPGDPSAALARLTQRMQEINPSFSQDELIKLLQKQALKPQITSYIIYPIYQTPDATSPKIDIAAIGGQQSPWIQQAARPEGTPKTVVTQNAVKDFPNTDWQQIIGGSCSPGDHYTEVSGQLNWEPGTGYVQSLGELRISHLTDCYFNAQ